MTKAVSIELFLDLADVRAVEESRRWILSAMHEYGQPIVSLLWRILGNEQDVCDAYQDTFLRLAHCQNGRKPENVKAYLFKCAGNQAISILRRKKIFDRACHTLVQDASAIQKTNYAGDLDAKFLQEDLRCHIARLPDHLRDVIMLHDLAELSYQQVAGILGIAIATARVYRCRAIQILAAWMADRK